MINNQITSILGIVIGITLIIEIIFYGVIFPFWILMDLNKSDLDKPLKIFYAIFIVLSWTFGAVVYGILSAKQKKLKILSVTFVILVIIQVIIAYLTCKCFKIPGITAGL